LMKRSSLEKQSERRHFKPFSIRPYPLSSLPCCCGLRSDVTNGTSLGARLYCQTIYDSISRTFQK
jgi:hypothetical protein